MGYEERGRHLIYGLIDPRTLLVRYIGKSSKGLARPKEHGNRHGLLRVCHRSDWIRSLHTIGLDYTIAVLQETTPGGAYRDEQWWVAYGRACGWPLTNHTDGGPGAYGRRPSLETRGKISAANRGRTISTEHRKKLSAALAGNTRTLGLRHTDEAKKKMSAARSGKPKPESHKKAIGAALRARRAYGAAELEAALNTSTCLKDIQIALGVSKTQACRLRKLYLGTKFAMR